MSDLLSVLRKCEFADEGHCVECGVGNWEPVHRRDCRWLAAMLEVDPSRIDAEREAAEDAARREEEIRNRPPSENSRMLDMGAMNQALKDLYSEEKVQSLLPPHGDLILKALKVRR